MHFKFQIKSVASKPEREGEYIVRFTGQSEYINVNDTLGSVLVTRQGKQIQKFKTGLDVSEINSNGFISPSERESFKKQVEAFREFLIETYGEEELSPTNSFFWKDPDYGKLKISNLDLEKYYDTRNPKHAILYFNIMGGGYADTVGPSKDYAERYRIPFYLETESEYVSEDGDSYLAKTEAFSLLNEIINSSDNQALLYLGWVLHSESKGFSPYTISTPKSDLVKMHGEYIEGKLQFKKKKQCTKKFIDVAKSWKDGKIGRPRIILEAYLRSADMYSYLNTDKEGKYSLPSGLQLGFSIESAVDTLLKPKNNQEVEDLRTYIEKKWAE